MASRSSSLVSWEQNQWTRERILFMAVEPFYFAISDVLANLNVPSHFFLSNTRDPPQRLKLPKCHTNVSETAGRHRPNGETTERKMVVTKNGPLFLAQPARAQGSKQ